MIFLTGIEQVSNVEWGRSHLWDCCFVPAIGYNNLAPPPPPFFGWFPAYSVDENLATLSSDTITGHLSTYPVPQRSSHFTISLSFYDDNDHTLARWFSDWINKSIFNGGSTVSPIRDIIRTLVFIKYKVNNLGIKIPIGQGDPLALALSAGSGILDIDTYGYKAYYVYPDTTLNFNGTSEAGIHQYTVNFQIAGNTSQSPDKSGVAFERFQAIKESLDKTYTDPAKSGI